MWLLEHLRDRAPLVREARRVLRSGGTITLTETDYITFKGSPPSLEWDYLQEAQYAFFERHGNANAGRQLGSVLCAGAFVNVRSAPVGFHFFRDGSTALRRHVDYAAELLEPGIDKMAALGFDRAHLRGRIDHLRSLPDAEGASFTQIVYRAHGEKGGV